MSDEVKDGFQSGLSKPRGFEEDWTRKIGRWERLLVIPILSLVFWISFSIMNIIESFTMRFSVVGTSISMAVVHILLSGLQVRANTSTAVWNALSTVSVVVIFGFVGMFTLPPGSRRTVISTSMVLFVRYQFCACQCYRISYQGRE